MVDIISLLPLLNRGADGSSVPEYPDLGSVLPWGSVDVHNNDYVLWHPRGILLTAPYTARGSFAFDNEDWGDEVEAVDIAGFGVEFEYIQGEIWLDLTGTASWTQADVTAWFNNNYSYVTSESYGADASGDDVRAFMPSLGPGDVVRVEWMYRLGYWSIRINGAEQASATHDPMPSRFETSYTSSVYIFAERPYTDSVGGAFEHPGPEPYSYPGGQAILRKLWVSPMTTAEGDPDSIRRGFSPP